MTIAAVFALLALLPAAPRDIQAEQSKFLKSCPVLTNAEAEAVLGAGTILASAVESTAGTGKWLARTWCTLSPTLPMIQCGAIAWCATATVTSARCSSR